MPKDAIVLTELNNMSTTIGAGNSPIASIGIKTDAPNGIAIPEKDDTIVDVDTDEQTVDHLVVEVDGVSSNVDIMMNGDVIVEGGGDVTKVAQPLQAEMNAIGRVVSVSNGNTHASKAIRIGYVGDNLINTPNDSIVAEDDYISSRYPLFGLPKKLCPINESQAVVLFYGARDLVLYDFDASATYRTVLLSSSEILDIANDIEAATDSGDYRAAITKIYYLTETATGRTVVKYIDFDECYTDGKTYDPAQLISANFESIDITNDTEFILDNSSQVTSGFIPTNLACTQSKIFVGYASPQGNSFAPLGGSDGVYIGCYEDLLFSFDRVTNDNDEPVILSCTTGKATATDLHMSMLPFNGYKTENKVKYNTRDHYIDMTPYMYGRIPIPYGSFLDIKQKMANCANAARALGTSAEDFNGYIAIPGGCGLTDIKTPTGKVFCADYDSDTVGYLMIALAAYICPNTLDPEGINTGAYDITAGNGVGYFQTYRVTEGGVVVYVVTPPDQTIYTYDLEKHIRGQFIFTWNGIQPFTGTGGYTGYEYTMYELGASSGKIYIKKHFDTAETNGGESPTFMRSCLALENIRIKDGLHMLTASTMVRSTASDTIDTVLLFDTTPPVVTSFYEDGESTKIDFNDYPGIRQLSGYIPETIEDSGKKYVSPDTAIRAEYSDGLSNVVNVSEVQSLTLDDAITEATDYTIDSITFTEEMGTSIMSLDTGSAISLPAGTYRYKFCFIYDGISISPLSFAYYDITHASPASTEITITFSTEQLASLSTRITGIRIYAAEVDLATEKELYRLVREVPLTNKYFAKSGDDYVAVIEDEGSRGASFNAESGYSETATNVSVFRNVQCMAFGHLYAGDVTIPDSGTSVKTNNVLCKSLPMQPSIFNYTNDFVVLPLTPVAIKEFNGRLYVFGKDKYCVVNPDNLAIEYTGTGVGCESKKHVVSTDYGIFLYFGGNIYHLNGTEVTPMADSIKRSIFTGIYSLEQMQEIVMCYSKKKNCIVVSGRCTETATPPVVVFVFNIMFKRWTQFIVDMEPRSEPTDPVYAAYEKDGEIYLQSDGVQACLWDATTNRECSVSWSLDFGDPNQNIILYSIDCYKNGNLVDVDKLLNGNAITFPYELKGDIENILTVSNPLSSFDSVRIVVRRKVIT